MATTAEMIRQENEAFKKAKSTHRARIKKLQEAELKRFLKIMKQTSILETEFSDAELLEGFKKMIEWKKRKDEKPTAEASSVAPSS